MSTVVEMASIGRPRQYVSAARLYAMFPVLRFSYERGAYVLRFVGETRGPVLRKNRRRDQQEFAGPDRRAGALDVAMALRPAGSVRRIEVDKAPPRSDRDSAADTAATSGAPKTVRRQPESAAASRRRRQHGRQRPPRPHR
jgi:hypothetical protein